jgi:ABC-2 type transport system ATP-binding protein
VGGVEFQIETRSLVKHFGAIRALDGLDLTIARGELFGLVGPDGAGKTTALRILSGIMDPTSGEAYMAGVSVTRDPEAVKDKIGYMSQRFGLYEDLTVMENILFYADLYEVARRERAARIERLLGFSNLIPFKDRLAGALSGGMKQKLGLACALIHTPEILLLDEPTNGVDPVSRRDLWRILYDLLKEGVTILITTAYLDEAERCRRVGLLNEGKLIVVDTPKNIKNSLGSPMVEITTHSARAVERIARSAPGVLKVTAYGDRLHVALQSMDRLAGTLALIKDNSLPVESAREITPSLEDMFIWLVERK